MSLCNTELISVECRLHALMCSVSVVTVVFIHTMEDDQRLNTLVHEGDTLTYHLSRYTVCAINSNTHTSPNSWLMRNKELSLKSLGVAASGWHSNTWRFILGNAVSD